MPTCIFVFADIVVQKIGDKYSTISAFLKHTQKHNKHERRSRCRVSEWWSLGVFGKLYAMRKLENFQTSRGCQLKSLGTRRSHKEHAMKKIVSTAAIATLALAAFAAPADIAERTEAKTFAGADGAVFRYRWAEKLPDDGSKVPLVIFLHGAGERGTNNVAQLRHGVEELLNWLDRHEKGYRLVAGQVPNGKRWAEVDWGAMRHTMPQEPSETMALELALIDKLLSDQRTDARRVYVTGISMGGYGTWDIICRRPQLFAAAMPICGGGDTAQAAKIAKVPIWVFHGSADRAVPVFRSRSMVSALWAAGSNAHYREYPDAGHNVWTRTYRDDEVLKWFFSQRNNRLEGEKK